MLQRLLFLLCLFLWSVASLTQQIAETCPVTKPESFVPPYPYPADISDSFWFGTYRLWISLPSDGIWKTAHVWSTDPASGNKVEHWVYAKVSWWRQGYDWRVDGKPKLKVTGRRLDTLAPPLVADEANIVGIRYPKIYMMDSLYFPTPGCWEVTGHYEDDELTFIVWVPK
jgi:hypothetical protein